MLFPGRAHVRENPAKELAEKIAHLKELGQRDLELDRQGRSVRDIVRDFCGAPMPVEFLPLGHFSRRWLVLVDPRGHRVQD